MQMVRGARSAERTLHHGVSSSGLPRNDAFWSLIMGDAKNFYVPNQINRYSVGDRSGLVSNADGSVDIYIQRGRRNRVGPLAEASTDEMIASKGCASRQRSQTPTRG
jgi:hypothetical protein